MKVRSCGSTLEAGPRRDGLFAVTLGYLLVPIVIFGLGWLRPGFAILILVAGVACGVDAWRKAANERPRLPRHAVPLVLALALFWVFATGIGETNVQSLDYRKHNLVFNDLVVEDWPVVYDAAPASPVLTYYVAYYLPAALAGKVLGLQHTAAVSLAWGLLGVSLAFAWFYRLGRPHGAVVLVSVMLIEGLCWLPGVLPLAQDLGLLARSAGREAWHAADFTIEFWRLTGPHTRLLFPPEISHLRWVPQHTVAAWLATACVLRSLLERRPARHAVVVNAATLLWSPFVAVGLAPFTVAAVYRDRAGALLWPNLIGAAMAIPVGLYFLGHYPQEYVGVLFASLDSPDAWAKYVLFLVLALGVFWFAAWLLRRRWGVPTEPVWRVVRLSCAVAIAVTFIHMGRYNDWVMRAGMPALLALRLTLALTAVELWTRPVGFLHRLAFSALLLLSAERTVKAWVLVPLGRAGGQGIETTIVTARQYADGLVGLSGTPEWDFAAQYLGRRDSFFTRWLMARSPSD